MYGRGAYDMKAGLAAALIACRDAAGPATSWWPRWPTRSSRASACRRRCAKCVRTPRSSPSRRTGEVIVAHKGFVWAEITLRGRAAHGSLPDEGVDAIAAAGPVLVRLARARRRAAGAPAARAAARSTRR